MACAASMSLHLRVLVNHLLNHGVLQMGASDLCNHQKHAGLINAFIGRVTSWVSDVLQNITSPNCCKVRT